MLLFKNRFVKFISLFSILLCSFCGTFAFAAQTTVTDAVNRVVTVPESVEKILITCYGGVTNQIVVLGAEDKIVGQPSMKLFPQLLKMRPKLRAIPDAGKFDNINIEEIISLNPDMVFAGIISQKGNKKIEEVGFPLVTMFIGKARVNVMKDEFIRTGLILGKQEKAKALVAYWNEKLELVRKRVQTIPLNKRLRVYYTSSDILHTEGRAWWTQDLLTMAGAVNVAESIDQAREATMEKLIEWNPDVIVACRLLGKKNRVENVLNNPQLKDIKAVENKRVYEFPIGAFWWNRPSPEAPLGVLWLTKTLYPELMADIDMKKETKYFFKTFFDYELSDVEYESFING
ncbi:ABC transporter substrate-binding protein [Maridesulfovibrio ferrireducens]|uniref:ABC transporter substrate-binding protein n=1 Tax=Maridesulfovibrio ferrireducens TaxID=246191 RepID=UPI001A20B02E|nr:ABC transporter substrate-binding protein [Maridesulfovibrio ferrireducens]MBI9113099.1 ABC transporter substrate-binding protein [Maridesulfovibrio ferrireducens]